MKIMIKQIFLLLSLLIGLTTQAQDSITISGHLKNNTRFAKVVVQKYGVGSMPIASTQIKGGIFRIIAPQNIEPGVYRFQYSQNSISDYIDIIINGVEKEISFTMDVSIPGSSPVFTKSESNKKWYKYKEASNLQLNKIAVLHQFL